MSLYSTILSLPHAYLMHSSLWSYLIPSSLPLPIGNHWFVPMGLGWALFSGMSWRLSLGRLHGRLIQDSTLILALDFSHQWLLPPLPCLWCRTSASLLFNSVQLLSCVQLFATPGTAARQVSLSITDSWSLLKLMSIESVMPSNHLILSHTLLLPPSIFPSIRVFSNESVLRIRWPKYWNFTFSLSPSSEYSGLISFRIDWLDYITILQFSLQNSSQIFICPSSCVCSSFYLHVHHL